MHVEAFAWVEQHATEAPVDVLDIGGRDVNGSPRALFPNAASYTVLDLFDGPNVDIVADAASWIPRREYDVIVCTEVFEHTASWPQICDTAFKACRPGGMLIATMAGPGRPVHSGIDGRRTLRPNEFYENVSPSVLRRVLAECGWRDVAVDVRRRPADVRAVAYR